MMLEALLLVVDRHIGSERASEFQIVGRDRRQHTSAAGLRELDSKVSHAARATMDQYRLPSLEPAVPEQPLPCCQPGQGNCGRVNVVKFGRLGRDSAFADDGPFGIAAAVNADHAEHFHRRV